MSTRMKKHKKDLCFLGRCNKVQRNNFLNVAPATLIQAISDSAKTLLEGDLPISNYYRKKLRKDIVALKKLARKSESITKKRTFLKTQKGGSLLGTIWKVVSNLF